MLRDILHQAAGSLRHNRRRSALTMLGMAWGIATVVLLLSYGSGFERAIMAGFSSFGTNMIMIFPGRTSKEAGGTKAGTNIRLTVADLDYIENEVPGVKHLSPTVFLNNATLQYGSRTSTSGINGVYPVYSRIRGLELEDGAFFNEEASVSRARVIVLGSDCRKKLFSGQNALGETVRVNGMSFQVVGTLKRSINDNDNANNEALIPFSVLRDLTNTYYLGGIFLTYEGPDHLKIAQTARNVMAAHHNFKPDDMRAVFVFDVKDGLKELGIITAGIKLLLTFIGILTLGIGGIGLMNIMLVAVTQRTREIGVEKALGARRRHILVQFLAEALAITFLGGLAGVLIAYVISWSVGSLTLWGAFYDNAGEGDIHLRIDHSILILSTLILTMVGLVSGMWPAIKASRLDPIEALRYE